MSPRRFDGWEPSQVIEHFGADGRPCKAADAYSSVITIEPEWDEESRGRVEALAEWRRGICPCGCGQPMSESHTPIPYSVKTFTCYAGRALAIANRNDYEEADRMKKPDGWDDGRHNYVMPVTSADD